MKSFRPYFTLTNEARRMQREERHRMWCEEDYQNSRRMLRTAIWYLIMLAAMALAGFLTARFGFSIGAICGTCVAGLCGYLEYKWNLRQRNRQKVQS